MDLVLPSTLNDTLSVGNSKKKETPPLPAGWVWVIIWGQYGFLTHEAM